MSSTKLNSHLNFTMAAYISAFIVLLAGPGVSGVYDSSFVITSPSETDACLVIDVDAPSCLTVAVDDLLEDSEAVTGKRLELLHEFPYLVSGSYIAAGVSGQSMILNRLEMKYEFDLSGLEGKREAFEIRRIKDIRGGIDLLIVAGSDPRGAMYGIYEISKEAFGVEPMHFWTGMYPEHKRRTAWDKGNYSQGPPSFKYRGIFINDEDFLMGWKGRASDRIVEPEIYKEILEALCRLRGNMIAPAMYAEYMDAESIKMLKERHLIYTASHLEILLSNPQIYWKEFCRKNWGKELAYSFSMHPDKLKQFWQDSINRHKDHEAIWPVGLRGITDYAFWRSDPHAPKTDKARAKFVENAIGFQLDLLRENLDSKDFTASLALYEEILDLYETGHLNIPDDIIMIWCDNGWVAEMRQLPGELHARHPGGNGVYFHLANCDRQWSQWVDLHHFQQQFQKIVYSGATDYALFNVGDIREIPLNIKAAMDVSWDSSQVLNENWASNYLQKWTDNYFGSAGLDAAGIYKRYFELEYPVSCTWVVELVAPYTHSDKLYSLWQTTSAGEFLEKGPSPWFIKPFASLVDFEKARQRRGQVVDVSGIPGRLEKWNKLYLDALKVMQLLQGSDRQFFFDNMILQIQISRNIHLWADSVIKGFSAAADGDFCAAEKHFTHAAQAMYTIESERQKSEHGKWKNWYRGQMHNGWQYSLWSLRPEVHAEHAEKLAKYARAAGRVPQNEFSQVVINNDTIALTSDNRQVEKSIRVPYKKDDIRSAYFVFTATGIEKKDIAKISVNSSDYALPVTGSSYDFAGNIEIDVSDFLANDNTLRFYLAGNEANGVKISNSLLVLNLAHPGNSAAEQFNQARTASDYVSIDMSDPVDWEPMTGWIGNPAGKYEVSAGNGTMFTVSEAGRGMKWRRRLDRRIDTSKYPYLKLRYRARDVLPVSEYFLYMSEIDSGMAANDVMPISLSSLICDGNVHEAVVKIEPMNINTLACQVQAATEKCYVEVLDISFYKTGKTNADKSIVETLNYIPGGTEIKEYNPVKLESNTNVAGWLANLGFGDSWFENEDVLIDNVYFNLCTGKKAMATTLKGKETLSVDIDEEPGIIYLLMGARFTGKETPSIGGGDIEYIEQPHRFHVELTYADGLVDRIFPKRLNDGRYRIRQGLFVYTVKPARDASVDKLSFIDNMDNGRFIVLAVSTGSKPMAQKAKAPKEQEPLNRATQPFESKTFSGSGIYCETDLEANKIGRLCNRLTNTEWLKQPTSVYSINSMAELDVKADASVIRPAQIRFDLQITNNTAKPVELAPVFPDLKGISPGGNTEELFYCFPKRGAVISNAKLDLKARYGGDFPLQYIDVYHERAGGVYILTCDMQNHARDFHVNKKDAVNISVEYLPRTLRPGETWKLPAVIIGTHENDWHDAFKAYKGWLKTWYKPAAKRKDWFREIFNFRQLFLSHPMPRPSGAFDRHTKEYNIQKVLEEDIKNFGGIDYLHIFDWYDFSYGPGDYAPWDYLGGVNTFQRQLNSVQQMGIPVGLYVQGVFVQSTTEIGKAKGEKWQALDSSGNPYVVYPNVYTICSSVAGWQDYIAQTCSRIETQLGPNGIYIDSIGMGPWKCYAADHGHQVPAGRVDGEFAIIKNVRRKLPEDTALYTEEIPSDVTTQYQDGAFTYAVNQSVEAFTPVRVNMARFAIPDFKTFEIIICDMPVGDDLEAIKAVFFNGEGIWLEGMVPEFYSYKACELIRKTHRILRKYRESFCSDSPVPLVETRHPEVFANYFPARGCKVWTLFNSGWSTVRANLIEVEHEYGMKYYDLWNDRPVTAEIKGDKALLHVEIGPRDVGCIAAKRR